MHRAVQPQLDRAAREDPSRGTASTRSGRAGCVAGSERRRAGVRELAGAFARGKPAGGRRRRRPGARARRRRPRISVRATTTPAAATPVATFIDVAKPLMNASCAAAAHLGGLGVVEAGGHAGHTAAQAVGDVASLGGREARPGEQLVELRPRGAPGTQRRSPRPRACRRSCGSSTGCPRRSRPWRRPRRSSPRSTSATSPAPCRSPSGRRTAAGLRTSSRRRSVVSQTIATETRDRPVAIGIRGPIRSVSRPAMRRDRDDHQRRRQESEPGLERRVAEDVLHVEGEEEELRQHREGDDQRDRCWSRRSCGSANSRNSTIGVFTRSSTSTNAARSTMEPPSSPGSRGSPSPTRCPRSAPGPARSAPR